MTELFDDDGSAIDVEQEFLLARLATEAQSWSKPELIEALVGAVAQRFATARMYTDILAANGIGFRLQQGIAVDFTDENALTNLFGYRPTDAEVEEFATDVMEVATMELDMDAIVLAPDE